MATRAAERLTTPLWESSSMPRFPKIESDLRVDVAIVGGGLTGLTAASLLTKAGLTVALLERGRCGAVDTGHTTAHLTMVTDTALAELVKRFGRDHAQAAWDAGLAALAQIDETIREHDIDCGFEWADGYLHQSLGEDGEAGEAMFRAEAAAAIELGFDVSYVSDVPWLGGPGVRYDNQARFDPRRYLAGLAGSLTGRGQIFELSDVQSFSASPLSLKANGNTVYCGDIIVATHNPVVGLASFFDASLFQTKLALYTSYVVAGSVPKGTVPDALFWDSSHPYRYMRIEKQQGQDLVILGGEDHKTGQAADTSARYERLENTMKQMLDRVEMSHRWSGQVIETPDGLPYIGRTAEHQYSATGFGGNGMTFGTLGAMMAVDAILGKPNPWTDLFDPSRKALTRGLWRYVKENADYPYYMIRDRFAGPETRDLRSVKRGQGKILERHGTKVAAYRDESGATLLKSATCPHLGCLVAWNDAERTWDCPCHGSRFTPEGDVIAGPAESPLPDPS